MAKGPCAYKVHRWVSAKVGKEILSGKTSEATIRKEVYLTANGKLLGALEEGGDRVRAHRLRGILSMVLCGQSLLGWPVCQLGADHWLRKPKSLPVLLALSGIRGRGEDGG